MRRAAPAGTLHGLLQRPKQRLIQNTIKPGGARQGRPTSERQAKSGLEAARDVFLRGDAAERSAGGRRVGDAETDLVKDVEAIDTGFETHRFVNRELLDELGIG